MNNLMKAILVAAPALVAARAFYDLEPAKSIVLGTDVPELAVDGVVPYLSFRLEVLESEKLCGFGNVSFNGDTLPQDASGAGHGALVSNEGTTFQASWNFSCVTLDNEPWKQSLAFSVNDVDGIPIQPSLFTVEFRQQVPVSIIGIESEGPIVPAVDEEEAEPTGHPIVGDLGADLAILELMKLQLAELQQEIAARERQLERIYGWTEKKAISDCDNLRCVFNAIYENIRDTAKTIAAEARGQGWEWPSTGKHPHHNHTRWPHHKPCGNHTHGNHTWPPPHHKPPHWKLPFCHCHFPHKRPHHPPPDHPPPRRPPPHHPPPDHPSPEPQPPTEPSPRSYWLLRPTPDKGEPKMESPYEDRMTPLRVDSEQPLFSAPYRPGRFTQKEQFQPPQPEDGGAIFIGMAVTLAGLAILLFIRATIRLLRFWRRRECLWARMQAARRRRCERRQQRAQRRAERREKFLAMRERLMAWFRRVGSLVRRLGWAAADDEEKNAMFRQDRLEQRQAVLDSHNSVQSPAVAAENASVARAAAAPPAHHAPTVDPRTATVPVTRTHRRRDSDSFSLDSSSSDNSHHSAGTSTSTSSGSTTLEQDLALFRSAADVVSDLLVAAEEGRSAASSRRQLEREHHYRGRARARREAAGSIHRYLLDGVPERLAEWIRRHYNPVAAAAAGAAPPTLPTHHVHMPIPIPTDTNRNGLTMHGHPANPQPMLPPSPSSSQFGSDDETLSVTDSLPAYEDVATLSDREHGVVADGIRFHRHGVGSHAHSRRTSGSSTPETRPSMEVIRQAGRVDDVLGPDTKN